MSNALTNIFEAAFAGKSKAKEIKKKQHLSGSDSILAVASVDMVKLSYAEFQQQIWEDSRKRP